MKLLIKINFIIALIVSLTSVSYACNFLKESMGTSIATLGDRYDEFTLSAEDDYGDEVFATDEDGEEGESKPQPSSSSLAISTVEIKNRIVTNIINNHGPDPTALFRKIDTTESGYEDLVSDAEDYVKMYCDQTNRKEIDNLDFYLAYNFFRLAGILQGILGRVRDGTAASEHAQERSNRVRPLAEAGWLYAQKAGAI